MSENKVCENCGSDNVVFLGGTAETAGIRYLYHCNNCKCEWNEPEYDYLGGNIGKKEITNEEIIEFCHIQADIVRISNTLYKGTAWSSYFGKDIPLEITYKDQLTLALGSNIERFRELFKDMKERI